MVDSVYNGNNRFSLPNQHSRSYIIESKRNISSKLKQIPLVFSTNITKSNSIIGQNTIPSRMQSNNNSFSDDNKDRQHKLKPHLTTSTSLSLENSNCGNVITTHTKVTNNFNKDIQLLSSSPVKINKIPITSSIIYCSSSISNGVIHNKENTSSKRNVVPPLSKCIEVVRGKERESLRGFTCVECAAYYKVGSR